MHMRCVDDTVGIGNDRQHSGLGHPDEAESELSAPKMEGSWKVDQIKMLSGVGSDRIPRLNFVAGAGFEPATSGIAQDGSNAYRTSPGTAESLVLLRCSLARTLPTVADPCRHRLTDSGGLVEGRRIPCGSSGRVARHRLFCRCEQVAQRVPPGREIARERQPGELAVDLVVSWYWWIRKL